MTSYLIPDTLGDAHGMPGVDGSVYEDDVADLDVLGAVIDVGALDAVIQQVQVKLWPENVLALGLEEGHGEVR